MLIKLSILLLSLAFCESVYVYSSFWAPFFDPRILNYRVDAKFDPNSGKLAAQEYRNKYGYRGENLIANLGNGKGLTEHVYDKTHGDVNFYYTYRGEEIIN